MVQYVMGEATALLQPRLVQWAVFRFDPDIASL